MAVINQMRRSWCAIRAQSANKKTFENSGMASTGRRMRNMGPSKALRHRCRRCLDALRSDLNAQR
jgi:hypothetical protein